MGRSWDQTSCFRIRERPRQQLRQKFSCESDVEVVEARPKEPSAATHSRTPARPHGHGPFVRRFWATSRSVRAWSPRRRPSVPSALPSIGDWASLALVEALLQLPWIDVAALAQLTCAAQQRKGKGASVTSSEARGRVRFSNLIRPSPGAAVIGSRYWYDRRPRETEEVQDVPKEASWTRELKSMNLILVHGLCSVLPSRKKFLYKRFY